MFLYMDCVYSKTRNYSGGHLPYKLTFQERDKLFALTLDASWTDLARSQTIKGRRLGNTHHFSLDLEPT